MGGRGADRVGTPLFVAVSTIAFLVALRPCHATITNQEIVAMSEAQAVAGGVAQLPCDVEPPINGDRLYLVIWYKEESNNPIYSFDCRGHGNVQHATHWSDSSIGNRAFFKQSDKPAKLNLESVTEKDNGLYRCRVDFKQSPTRNSKVNLTVIIPPERLSILDEDGIAHIQNYILGPYSEGASVNITCVATGGRPQPRVTWWDESVLLDESFEAVGNRSVRNVLRLEKLERKHLSTTLTCQASNNNMVTPIVGTVTLNMNLKPLWVRLQGENRPLSAGTTYEIECEVVGARPTPDVIWSKGNIPLKNTRLTVSPDGNTTTSTLTFVPSIEDAGKFLSCKGSVPSIPHSTIEDGWKLDIHHTPVVTLELGSNLNGSPIREGIDVYFECNIKSNPWVYKVSWRHNGNPLYHNAAAGTIVSNQSLVLQSVTRSRTGIYTCVGSNREGDGESNALNLDIKFAPVCRPGQTKVYGVARQETVRIRCELEANPANVSFTWRFNSSAEAVDIAQAHVTSDRAQSVVSYTPMTESDYGSLVCLGVNDQGAQLEPCVYTIVPAGHPDNPHNCSVLNQTTDSLHVECTEGFDGGLPQEFTLEIDIETGNELAKAGSLVYNSTSKVPMFSVNGLDPGTTYHVTVFASNSKGRSEPVRLKTTTLNLPERRTGERLTRPPSPENCTIREESRTMVRVSCAESEYFAPNTATYVLQVFDAGSRRLLASATSLTPSILEVTDLPAERSQLGLVLSLRIMTAHATSDATVLHSQHFVQEGETLEHQRYPALTPVMLSLSGPLLGAVVGAAAGLLLVIFVIVLAVRLRYRPRPQDDKDSHDDGGMANLAAPNEKTSSLPANADSIESFEKNPDIIPHANENSYAELCKGASPRFILPQSRQLQDQSSFGPNGNNVSCYRDITGASPARVRQKDVKKCLTNASTPLMPQSIELTYAELSLQRGGRRVPPNCYQPVPVAGVQRPQLLPMSTLTRRQQPQDPTIYAQVATGKSVYIPPPHPYLTRGVDETTAETPLIGRENKLHQIYSYRSKKPSYIPRDGSKALIQRIKNLLIRTEITTPKFPPLGRRIIIVSQ
ncbi:neural cell adhesion molecule L1-like protein isoform X2 [Neodiprion virginianus]|uniref:neural cell adhesion molecule L1-like protein isoform X2 n=1 Tax=Neodiprion virginianus TaxID=2961670 RepID=UPI001EE76F9E|nr:neural cell adhesion molecule L1-like protein isoform X2 [Neodiprion virginianus]